MASQTQTTQIGGDTVSYSPSTLAIELRDFSKGLIRKYSINTALVPPNSVAHSMNWNFDTIIGSAVVRPGTTLVGAQVVANKTPLGLFEFVTSGQAKNYILAVFSGASNASLYYFDGSAWNTSGLTSLSNTAKNRFDMLNGYAYIANGTNAFKYSADGNTWTSVSFTGPSPVTIAPSLILQTQSRIIVSGATATSRSRVYFSSVVSPGSTPGVTFNTDATVGDWIDINPDDGDDVTAFGQTSGLIIVFKRNAMYRLDVINKTVDATNVFPFGCVSQEAVVNCQGILYFFTGQDIRSTNGGFPTLLSRLGVQDFIDAIPQSNWATVAAGTDGNNVYFSIGNVTVPLTGGDAVAYTNVVLKYSVLDTTWSAHYYAQQPEFYCQYTDSTNGRKIRSADTGGNVQTVNVGVSDNGSPICYDLQTQEIEFATYRAHVKQISQNIVVYGNYLQSSQFQVKSNERDWKTIPCDLEKRVNKITEAIIDQGNYFTFRLTGVSLQKAPVFEGLYLESITDLGLAQST